MPQYVLKILVDIEARDDIEARQTATAFAQAHLVSAAGVKDIVLHARNDNKSIRMNQDGTFPGQWNKGGQSTAPVRS